MSICLIFSISLYLISVQHLSFFPVRTIFMYNVSLPHRILLSLWIFANFSPLCLLSLSFHFLNFLHTYSFFIYFSFPYTFFFPVSFVVYVSSFLNLSFLSCISLPFLCIPLPALSLSLSLPFCMSHPLTHLYSSHSPLPPPSPPFLFPLSLM